MKTKPIEKFEVGMKIRCKYWDKDYYMSIEEIAETTSCYLIKEIDECGEKYYHYIEKEHIKYWEQIIEEE